MKPSFSLAILLIGILVSCQSSPQIEEGYWTGTLTPMNHPDLSNPMGYEVSYEDDSLTIQIVGPDSSLVTVYNTRVENDTLFFQFDEPEEQVTLDCMLASQENPNEGFAGRCTDESGKWARFTMIPPR